METWKWRVATRLCVSRGIAFFPVFLERERESERERERERGTKRNDRTIDT